MPPPHCHFTTRAPSPATIEYTVSTSSPPKNIRSRCFYYITILLRALVGCLALFAVAVRYGLLPATLDYGYDDLRNLPLSRFVAVVVMVGFLVTRRFHSEESLLILRTLGIQTTTLSSSYLLPSTTRFIPTSQIRDIFIHEAFRGFEVRFYLCVVLEDEGETVVVFPKLLPNRHILEQVWRGARECLYEPKE
ncbi:MAG: hypothetical protein Q9166_005233 [cf. Caloplaca sp. 2 TL-2023]